MGVGADSGEAPATVTAAGSASCWASRVASLQAGSADGSPTPEDGLQSPAFPARFLQVDSLKTLSRGLHRRAQLLSSQVNGKLL